MTVLSDRLERGPSDCEHGYRAAGGTTVCPVCDADRDLLHREIEECREQVTHLRGTLCRELLPQHRAKIEIQYAAACDHLVRLEKMAA